MPLKKAANPRKVKKTARAKSPKAGARGKGPKRPTSAYLFYSLERRAQIVKEHPELKADIAGVAKRIGEEWRGLSGDAKRKYEDMASKDRARYEAEKKKGAAK